MKKILFIICSYSKGGPQALRFQNIIEFLKNKMEIHVIELHSYKGSFSYESGIWLHKIEYSFIGKYLHPGYKTQLSTPARNNSNRFFKSKLKKFIRHFFFPDTFISERKRLASKAFELIRSNDIYTVVASGFPFTTMILSKSIKRKFHSVEFIYDIGDPFYNNSSNGLIRDWFAKQFERKYLKYIDKLVVTNKATLQHYYNNFRDAIRPEKIVIIEAGVRHEFIQLPYKNIIHKRKDNSVNELRLVYAGQFYMKLREPFELYKAVLEWNRVTSHKKIRLEIFGAISDIYKLSGQQNSYIIFNGRVSNKEVIQAYINGDIIVFIDNAWGLQTPGKVFEVAAIGKPVLFISDHVDSPASEIVNDLKHIQFCNNNCNSIIEAIKSINMKTDLDTIEEIREKFSWKNRSEQYLTFINH